MAKSIKVTVTKLPAGSLLLTPQTSENRPIILSAANKKEFVGNILKTNQQMAFWNTGEAEASISIGLYDAIQTLQM